MSKKNKIKKREIVMGYPAKVVAPVKVFLTGQIKTLKKRKRDLKKEDPFSNSSRISDNASPDTDAAEQFGHSRVEAVRSQLDRKMIQTRKALTRLRMGKYGICEDCGKLIDTDRLSVKPEAIYCAKCKAKRE